MNRLHSDLLSLSVSKTYFMKANLNTVNLLYSALLLVKKNKVSIIISKNRQMQHAAEEI